MLDAHREDKRALAARVLTPGVDDVADDVPPAHDQLETTLVVVAGARLHAGEVRRVEGEAGQRHQVALLEQLARLRSHDKVLEEIPEAAPIQSERRGGKA